MISAIEHFLLHRDISKGSSGISKGTFRKFEFSLWQFHKVSEGFHSFQFIGEGLDAGGMSYFTGYVNG